MGKIQFFAEKIRFKIKNPKKTSNWIKNSIEKEGFGLGHLNVIFCNDSYLEELNSKYLNHKTLTDIITFDYSDSAALIHGDIFISVPRVKENSLEFKADFDTELHRVIIHGILHLMGYSDKSKPKKQQMRKKEDSYLSLRT
ncbi:MAG: rRNA maturation RNase YbeY [Cyclobacteriaceae bacterium]|nr:rRNA maturation RNase YbeY [Cyclobacteriaceae bacterium]